MLWPPCNNLRYYITEYEIEQAFLFCDIENTRTSYHPVIPQHYIGLWISNVAVHLSQKEKGSQITGYAPIKQTLKCQTHKFLRRKSIPDLSKTNIQMASVSKNNSF